MGERIRSIKTIRNRNKDELEVQSTYTRKKPKDENVCFNLYEYRLFSCLRKSVFCFIALSSFWYYWRYYIRNKGESILVLAVSIASRSTALYVFCTYIHDKELPNYKRRVCKKAFYSIA